MIILINNFAVFLYNISIQAEGKIVLQNIKEFHYFTVLRYIFSSNFSLNLSNKGNKNGRKSRTKSHQNEDYHEVTPKY